MAQQKPPDLDATGKPVDEINITIRSKPPDLDDTGNPISETGAPPDIPAIAAPIPPVPQQPNYLEQAYHHIFDAPKFVTEPAREFAESTGPQSIAEAEAINRLPHLFGIPLGPRMIKSELGGMVEGAASLLSPANILTMGRGRLPQLANKILGGAQATHGGAEIAQGNVAEGIGDIAFGSLNIASARGKLPKIADDIGAEQNIRINPQTGEQFIGDSPFKPEFTQEALPFPEPQQNPAITRLTQAIDEGILKAKEQAVSYTGERAERISKAKAVTTPGEQGFFEQLGFLKGKYERLKMPPLREVLAKEDIDELYNLLSQAPVDDEFTKIHAKSGLLKLLNGEIPQKNELDLLNAILKTAIDLPGDPKLMQTPSRLRQVYELTRGMMSVDIPFMTSAAFRQGAGLFGTRNWFKAFADSARSFPSQKVYDRIMEGIENSPIHKQTMTVVGGQPRMQSIADEIGLAQSDLKSLTKREEQIRSVLSEKIPVYGRLIRGSNRAFTAFLNSLRTHTAEDWLKAYNAINDSGVENIVTAKKIANTINELTGHGSLRIAAPLSRFTKSGRELNLEKAHDALSMIFFSPRLLARDARMMNPLNYMMTDKLIRQKYLAGAIRRAGVWASFTGLATGLGAEIVSDPTNSDFGKAKTGDTRLDAGTGLLQWLTLYGRQVIGEYTSSTRPNRPVELGSSVVAPTRKDLATNFLTNRLHPTLSLPAEAMAASEAFPFHPGSETLERFLPLFTGDLIELFKNDPELEQILMGIIGAGASMGTMTYGREVGEPTFDVPGDPAFEGGRFLGR